MWHEPWPSCDKGNVSCGTNHGPRDLEDLSQWQKNIIDERLELYKNHPERIMPVEQFFEQMDKYEDEV